MAANLITVPNLKEHSTQAFRIGDIKQSIKEFNDKLSSLCNDAPNTSDQPNTIDASVLRPTTEIDYLAQATSQKIPNTPATDATSPQPAEQQPEAQPSSTDHPPLQTTPTVALPTQDMYQSCVTEFREKKAAEMREAALRLYSLGSTMTSPTATGAAVGPSRITSPRLTIPSNTTTITGDNTTTAVDRNTTNATAVTINNNTTANNNNNTSNTKVSNNDVVIRITVFLPHAPSRESEEWLVLGSQPLTALRDVIYCLTEENAKNIEKNEKKRKYSVAKSSAYFYIEGTFYIDSRVENAVDYSEIIREYNREHTIHAPPHPSPAPLSQPLTANIHTFSIDSMQNRKFQDIWIRLGKESPSLYCHQGGCEHLLIFNDVRMHDPATDPIYTSQYPYRLSNQGDVLIHRRKCEVCHSGPARKLTWDDKNTPHNPFYWCDECYRLMHYDAGGRVLYTDYQVFPYSHDYQVSMLQSVAGSASSAKKRKVQRKRRGRGGSGGGVDDDVNIDSPGEQQLNE